MKLGCVNSVALGFLGVVAGGIPHADAQRLVVSRADCERLVSHVPAPDVAYAPGVDVYGRPVAPADLPGSRRVALPETITFDANADLRRFNLPKSSRLYAPNVLLGKVTVERDGRVLFDGQPLQRDENAAIAELCRQRLMPQH